jgi:hypothetical protein
MFARSVGSALGIAVFGAISNGVIRNRTDSVPSDLAQLPAGVLEPAVHAVFVAAAAIAVLLLAASSAMPKRVVPPDVTSQ